MMVMVHKRGLLIPPFAGVDNASRISQGRYDSRVRYRGGDLLLPRYGGICLYFLCEIFLP